MTDDEKDKALIDAVFVIGILHGMCSSFDNQMGDEQKELFMMVTKRIEKIFYAPTVIENKK